MDPGPDRHWSEADPQPWSHFPKHHRPVSLLIPSTNVYSMTTSPLRCSWWQLAIPDRSVPYPTMPYRTVPYRTAPYLLYPCISWRGPGCRAAGPQKGRGRDQRGWCTQRPGTLQHSTVKSDFHPTSVQESGWILSLLSFNDKIEKTAVLCSLQNFAVWGGGRGRRRRRPRGRDGKGRGGKNEAMD